MPMRAPTFNRTQETSLHDGKVSILNLSLVVLHQYFSDNHRLFTPKERNDQPIPTHESWQLAITLSYPYRKHRCGTRESIYN